MKFKIMVATFALCFSPEALITRVLTTEALAETRNTEKVDPTAVKVVVDKWLALVDSGAYKVSWKKSSELFRSTVSEESWIDQITKARAPLGKLVKRELRLKQVETSLPGAPDGHYVIFQYVTSFENKKNATETVTPHLDKDKQWRVSGYVIR